MNRADSISILEIQKAFGADWVYSALPNAYEPKAVEVVQKNNISVNITNKNSEIPINNNGNNNVPDFNMENSYQEDMARKKQILAEPSSHAGGAGFKLHSGKSTEEWVKIATELAEKSDTLEELKKAVESFEGLSIRKTATNTVFAEGNPKAKIMLIGEAPGENEDLKGVPFCGVSGKLLDAMMKQLGFTRHGHNKSDSFYITNSVFWRPPGNRKPTPEEIAICKPFVEKHIALLKPDIIILIGATATVSVLNSKESISLLRGKKQEYNNPHLKKPISCFAIYHPSFLLRQPAQKKNTWFDLLKIKKFFESL